MSNILNLKTLWVCCNLKLTSWILNLDAWKQKGTKIYPKQNCPKIAKLYQFAWYFTLWSFQPRITSSYGKVDKLNFFWLNMWIQMSKCVDKQFESWFFMKAQLLKVLSSSTEPETWTITISPNFLYSLSLHIKTWELLIFIHNLETRFLSKLWTITGFALWFIISWKKKTVQQVVVNIIVVEQRFQLWFSWE